MDTAISMAGDSESSGAEDIAMDGKREGEISRAAEHMVRSLWRKHGPDLIHNLCLQEEIGWAQADIAIRKALEPYATLYSVRVEVVAAALERLLVSVCTGDDEGAVAQATEVMNQYKPGWEDRYE